MRSLDIDQLRAFLAIAETGSFSRAAERVHRTQAAVSVQMKRLEELVGTRLIDRLPRTSRLTAEGERLKGYAERLVALNDETVRALAGDAVAGHIRLGAPLYMQRFFPEFLARFSRTHPQVEVEIMTAPSQEMLASVQAGELDVALITHRSGGEVGEIVRREPLYWVTSPEHDAHARPVLPLALYHPTSALRSIATEALDGVGRAFRIAYSSPNTEAICAAVAAGLAVTILPRCSIGDAFRILDGRHGFPPLPVCDISLVRSPGAETRLRKAFTAHLRSCLAEFDAFQAAPKALDPFDLEPGADAEGAPGRAPGTSL